MQKKITEQTDTQIIKTLINSLSLPSNIRLDAYWVPEGEGLWFKPVRLNTIQSYYTGMWYSEKSSMGGYHYHSGATHGIMLSGLMRFIDKENQAESVVKATDYFYIPGGVTHKAAIDVTEQPFLFYGTIEGSLIYLDDDNKPTTYIDVFTYVELAKKHYQTHKLDLSLLQDIIV